MKRLIYGITDLADLLYYALRSEGTEIEAFIVNKEFFNNKMHFDKPVIPYEDIERFYNTNKIGIYLCLGYKSMNRHREKIYQKITEKGITVLSYMHPTALVMADHVGEGNLFFEHSVVGAYSEVGNANIFYPKSMLAHHSICGDFNFFAISSSVAGHVTIGNNCFFGNNSFTNDGICIADYTLAGAGSYVWEDTDTYHCIVPTRGNILSNHKSTELL